MNRQQWNDGRKYEKLPEMSTTWEAISPDDPRFEETLKKIVEDGKVLEVNKSGFHHVITWSDYEPPKPRLL